MQICIIVTQVLVIFWLKKNGIFTLKNEILKHTDFASEWRKSCFRGLEIDKIFRGRMLPDPPTGGLPKVAPFHRTPSTENLDPPQIIIVFVIFIVIFKLLWAEHPYIIHYNYGVPAQTS